MHFSKRYPGLIILLLLVVLALSACGGKTGSSDTTNEANLPDFVKKAPPRVREAYQFAVDHPDELSKYPCYCGCGAMGHTSNLSCYISDRAEDGTITFDNHAVGCGICVDITQDVIRLRSEGESAPEIRAYVDAQYSPFGPSTNTPLPLE
ncbi:MAG: hypothetical protein HY866_01765 [Chloroflexi bacterium]|nr:hypothetical protein [Chloroflexota bacterium]